MDNYFVALEPESSLRDLILEQKEKIEQVFGKQTYLNHPPHMTLFIFTTDNIEGVKKALPSLSSTLSSPVLQVRGFHFFYDDVYTKKDTLAYAFDPTTTTLLRTVQKQVVTLLMQYNTKQFTTPSAPEFSSMGPSEKENIRRYAYPFVGDVWLPHFTLASLHKADLQQILPSLNEIRGEYRAPTLALYRVSEPSELIARYDLHKS